MKLPLVAPPATKTEVGTDRLVLLSDKATERPTFGAAELSITAQFAVAGVVSVVGEHRKEVSAGGAEDTAATEMMVPPAPDKARLPPEGEAATVPLTPMEVLVTADPIVTFTTATVPFGMIFAFRPEARHV